MCFYKIVRVLFNRLLTDNRISTERELHIVPSSYGFLKLKCCKNKLQLLVKNALFIQPSASVVILHANHRTHKLALQFSDCQTAGLATLIVKTKNFLK